MERKLPLISIIIPCRNEEKYIGKCLDSIIANDYPKDRLEILIGDGMSEDRTREIIQRYIKKYSFVSNAKREKQGSAKQVLIKLFDNPKKIAPVAQNIGIKNSKGEIIIIMDAHVTYQKYYISNCLKYLKEKNADNVGGILITTPAEKTLIARAIALSLSHPLGAGNSYFRIGSPKLRWVDSVPYGCYRKEIFKKIGLYNEKLARSYDMEFNLRLKKAGGKTLLVPDIVAHYYPKSNLKDFFVHNFKDGVWAIYPLKFVKTPFRLRHYMPLIFVASVLGTGLLGSFFPIFFKLSLLIIGLYFFVNLYFSAKITTREKDLRYLFALPIVFATRHFGYGLGSIWGLIKLLLPIKK